MASHIDILGRWHLVPVEADVMDPAIHRVTFDFRDGPDGLHGVVIGRFRDMELPLQTLLFDGTTLRLQMTPPPGRPIDALPFLVMVWNGERFDGQWDMPSAQHLHLKLVRAS